MILINCNANPSRIVPQWWDWKSPKLAGPPGVEPGKAVLETAVIPFHHRPKYIFKVLNSTLNWKLIQSQSFINYFRKNLIRSLNLYYTKINIRVLCPIYR